MENPMENEGLQGPIDGEIIDFDGGFSWEDQLEAGAWEAGSWKPWFGRAQEKNDEDTMTQCRLPSRALSSPYQDNG